MASGECGLLPFVWPENIVGDYYVIFYWIHKHSNINSNTHYCISHGWCISFYETGQWYYKTAYGNYARVYNCCSEFWISQKWTICELLWGRESFVCDGIYAGKISEIQMGYISERNFFLAGGYAGTCNYVQNCIYIVTAVGVQRFWNCSCVYVQFFTYFLCLFCCNLGWLCSYMELLYGNLSPKLPILRRQG